MLLLILHSRIKREEAPLQAVQTNRVTNRPKLSPQGRKLLDKALAAIKAYPETFELGDWITHGHNRRGPKRPEPYCGTQACIAGHIVLAAGVRLKAVLVDGDIDTAAIPKRLQEIARKASRDGIVYTPDLAEHLLGLNKGEACDLFCEWPSRFSPRAVVSRVRHWLRTGE